MCFETFTPIRKNLPDKDSEFCEFFKIIKNKTYEINKRSVKIDGLALKYIIDQNDELCELAVKQNGFALKFVDLPTLEIFKLAVSENGAALIYTNPHNRRLNGYPTKPDEVSLSGSSSLHPSTWNTN